MIAAILPGFRDVRTALVSGYLWVGALLLFMINNAPSLVEPPYPVSDGLLTIMQSAGATGLAIAFSATALGVGQLLTGAQGHASERLSVQWMLRASLEPSAARRHDWHIAVPLYLQPFRPFTTRFMRRIAARVERAGAPANMRDTLRRAYFFAPWFTATEGRTFEEFERRVAEAMFRESVSLPLPIFVWALLLNLQTSMQVRITVELAAVLAALTLFHYGRRMSRDAHSMVGHQLLQSGVDLVTGDDDFPDPEVQPPVPSSTSNPDLALPQQAGSGPGSTSGAETH